MDVVMFVERLYPLENEKKKIRKNNAFSKALIWEVCCVCFSPISFYSLGRRRERLGLVVENPRNSTTADDSRVRVRV